MIELLLERLRGVGRLIGTLLRSLSFAAWLAALLLLTPITWRTWPRPFVEMAPALQSVSPEELLRTGVGHFYLILAAAILFVFAVACTRRMAITLWSTCFLVIFQVATSAIGWGHIGLWLLAICICCFLVEFIRQNAAIVTELRRRKIQLLPVALKAVLLWSPMLIGGTCGYALHRWLNFEVQQLAYRTTPIDEYCVLRAQTPDATDADAGQVLTLPCRETDGRVETESIKSDTFEEDAVSHVHQLYLNEQQWLLSQVVIRDGNIVSTVTPLADIAQRLQAALRPGSLIGLPEVELTLDERIAQDAQATELQAQIIKLANSPQARIVPFRGWGAGIQLAIVQATNQKKAALQAQLDARKKAIATEMAAVKAPPPTPIHELLQALSRGAAALKVDLTKATISTGAPADQVKAIGHFVGESVRTISGLTQKTEELVGPAIQKWRQQRSPADIAEAYSALGITHLCSLAKKSARLFTDTTYKEMEDINLEPFPCIDTRGGEARATSVGFRKSADNSIAYWNRTRAQLIEEDTRKAFSTDLNARDSVVKDAQSVLDKVPEGIHLGRQYCSWWPGNWANCLANYAKSEAEHAYRDARATEAQKYTAAVNRSTTAGEVKGEQVILATHANATELLVSSTHLLQVAVDKAIEYVSILDTCLVTLLVFALVNSFLYVLAVVTFSRKGGGAIRLPGDVPSAQGTFRIVTPLDKNITVSKAFKPRLITKAILNNQTNRFVPAPWPLSGVLGRLLHRKYFAYNIGGPVPGGKGIVLSWNNRYIVDWQLSEGEEVVFRYGNFFGASENIEIHTTISLSLATLLLGRIVFPTASCKEGTGHLLLVTDTLEVNPLQNDEVDSMLADRLLAFNKQVEFSAHCELTMRSVLIDGHILTRTKTAGRRGRVLVASPSEGASMWRGALRFMGRLLSPF